MYSTSTKVCTRSYIKLLHTSSVQSFSQYICPKSTRTYAIPHLDKRLMQSCNLDTYFIFFAQLPLPETQNCDQRFYSIIVRLFTKNTLYEALPFKTSRTNQSCPYVPRTIKYFFLYRSAPDQHHTRPRFHIFPRHPSFVLVPVREVFSCSTRDYIIDARSKSKTTRH